MKKPNVLKDSEIIKLDKLIRLSLVTAWEFGKRQKDTPYKYNLDTDKLGQPIFDLFKFNLQLQKSEIENIIWEYRHAKLTFSGFIDKLEHWAQL